jgi:hypothetical protein
MEMKELNKQENEFFFLFAICGTNKRLEMEEN